MNGLKTVLATTINGISVIAVVRADTVEWPQAGVMIAGSVIGGYGGAVLAQRVSPEFIRYLVMAIGIGMTIYFFIR
jgi:hypothetical protein